ncbi:VanZ family protein [Streptomyces rubellomurinus]|uniref:VanZ family protein n=1 Tax=Streptomyces rubellomurinus (strain ATCC 31215) TaxID=359131 RepID=UPI0006965467|nr:VanZ family protein [Streptomyces rubellomurinus]
MQRDGTRNREERSGARTETRPAAVVHRSLRRTGLAGLVCHLTVVLWLVVLRPLPVAWVYDANLTPLASLRSSTGWQVVGELLLLAPLGVLLPLAGGRVRAPWLPSFLRTTGVSALLATGLEFLSSWTPGHVLNVDHILLAVIGVAVTHLALVPGLRRLLRERRPGARAARPARTDRTAVLAGPPMTVVAPAVVSPVAVAPVATVAAGATPPAS